MAKIDSKFQYQSNSIMLFMHKTLTPFVFHCISKYVLHSKWYARVQGDNGE